MEASEGPAFQALEQGFLAWDWWTL